ncbi:hypothetical protein [Tissierella sp.]|uniref:hypothetical protein n=1 Tax=Tissierella sp. TaxID=41274 RepID=UPI002864B750|nr:hypothetical protein [Tissierella sp.]MDR7855064.1 hypothetical protein [Tissierella sp.]
MKKPRLIGLTLIIVVVLMGVGYAAWQETLTINGNITTGELNMEFVDNYFYPFGMTFDNKILQRDYFGQCSLEQDEANDLVTVTINDMYPGSTFNYELRANNIGTIPATVDNVVVDLSNTDDLFDETIRVSGSILHRREGRILSINRLFLVDVPLNELQTTLNNGMAGWEIKIGDYIVFDLPQGEDDTINIRDEIAKVIPGYTADTTNCLFFHMPLSAGNEIQDLSGQEFSIKFNFKQFNQ